MRHREQEPRRGTQGPGKAEAKFAPVYGFEADLNPPWEGFEAALNLVAEAPAGGLSKRPMSTTSYRLHSACACSTSGPFALRGTQRKYERSRPFVVSHLCLELSVELTERAISGTATLDFRRRASSGESLELDAVGFVLQSVSLETDTSSGRTLAEGVDYSYDGDTIDIPIPPEASEGTVTVRYRAVPKMGLYFLLPDELVTDRPTQVWSQCQDEDGRFWFPCQDKPHVKMTSEMRVTVPRGMSVLSGGELVEKRTPRKGDWFFHYVLHHPSPAYLMTLVVGRFEEWSESVTLPSGRQIDLRYMVPPGKVEDGKRAFHRTKEMIRLFSETIGVEYPWDRYTQVVVSEFIFGGMENTTATTMYEHILLDERASLDIESHDLVAHELAHQWFGDLVTCRDWSHAWLNEGFATFFELVEKEARLGRSEYEQAVSADLEVYLGEADGRYKRPIVCRDYEEPIDLFDRHLYQKGGLVLHMLRRELGNECFWRAVRTYIENNRDGIVETNDLMRALEEASGISLEKFFDQWVYRPGHPMLTVHVAYSNGLLTIDVEQTQKGDDVPVFEFPLEVEVSIDGRASRHVRQVRERKESLVVRSDRRPQHVAIDPDYRIVAPIKLHAPADLTKNCLAEGPTARCRRMAAESLSRRSDPATIEALASTLMNEEEEWMVRAACANALGKIGDDVCEAHLVRATSIDHPKVRRQVAQSLREFKGSTAVDALVGLTRDRSYLVSASAARALGRTRHPDAPDVLWKLLGQDSWADVIRAGALDALATMGHEPSLDHLMDWSRYGRALRARRAAIAALPKLSEGPAVRRHLVDLLDDRDPHIRVAVLSALEALGDKRARSPIGELLDRELDGRVIRRARQVLTALGKEGAPGLRELREKNGELERELSTLKARLSRLEQSHEHRPSRTASSAKAAATKHKKTSQKSRSDSSRGSDQDTATGTGKRPPRNEKQKSAAEKASSPRAKTKKTTKKQGQKRGKAEGSSGRAKTKKTTKTKTTPGSKK